jgi:antitoxin ParD1/3/4
MATMNISLPDQLKEWIEAQVESRHFSNTSDFMRDLVRDAKECDDQNNRLRTEINKGLKSEVHSGTVRSFFDDAHATAQARSFKAKPK